MGLFGKKCSVCGAKLPDKRQYKGVCNVCGMNYQMFSQQMKDTINLVEGAKTALTGYNRCLFGMRLTELLAPYVEAHLYSFPQGDTEAQMKYFKDAAWKYSDKICAENAKKNYARKIGIAPFSHYKMYHNPKFQPKEGGCKACGEMVPINKAGYCLDCISRVTTIQRKELEEYKASHNIDGMAENDVVIAAIRQKLMEEQTSASL